MKWWLGGYNIKRSGMVFKIGDGNMSMERYKGIGKVVMIMGGQHCIKGEMVYMDNAFHIINTTHTCK